MKFISSVFALYFLAMALYPCADDKASGCDPQISAVLDRSNDSDSAPDDSCSPLCICSCCATHVQINQTAFLVSDTPVHNTGLTTPYVENTVIENGDAIWQPPKL